MDREQLQKLINNPQENLSVEIKPWLDILGDTSQKESLATEIMALANHGGGCVIIGFDEVDNRFEEATPKTGDLEKYSQDNICNIVEKYLMPSFQCEVENVKPINGQYVHPVIIVPGDHRTPIWARKGSSDNKRLRNDKVYVRRPGGHSEPARTQDDWEKLIERLVRARQSEVLHAVRGVLEGPKTKNDIPLKTKLDGWDKESYGAWSAIVDNLPVSDSRRLESGHWTISFYIENFSASITDLNSTIRDKLQLKNGWPPFAHLPNHLSPEPKGEVIETWLGKTQNGGDDLMPEYGDYWRVSTDGYGFILRPFWEDTEYYLHGRFPKPDGPFFDWQIPIYRVAEILKFIGKLGGIFSDSASAFHVLLQYFSMNGRSLENHNFGMQTRRGLACKQDKLVSEYSGRIGELDLNLEEVTFSLLVPIFEQFEFAELQKELVNSSVREICDF